MLTATDNICAGETSPDLYDRLKLLGQIAKRNALSVNYRVVALNKEFIRAASPFGAMRCPLELGLESEICVDATAFLGSLHTTKATFTAAVKNHSLYWKCGGASGRLTSIEAKVAEPHFNDDVAPLGRDFGKGLKRGALGCGHSSFLRNAGLEAVQLINRNGKAYALSSDSTVLSSCCLGPALPSDRIATLKPEAAALLAEVVQRAATTIEVEMYMGIDEKSVYCLTPGVELQLYQLYVRQDYNLADKLRPFLARKLTVPIFPGAVGAFLKRVDSCAEIKQQAVVTITIEDGWTALRFAEIGGATEEHYEVTDAPRISVPPIRVDARRLAKGLAHATELVFDYAEQNILVLRGPDEFIFGITGRRL